MVVRGNTPPQGHTHYKLVWYALAGASAAKGGAGALCVACKAVAVAAKPKVAQPATTATQGPPVAPATTVAA